jgi:sarcosine oxidase
MSTTPPHTTPPHTTPGSAPGTTVVDTIVVGAGAAGSATAWMLARRGQRVALLDRFPAGHQRGSSHGTERIFRFVYAEREYVRLALEARPLWSELERDAGVEILTICGGIDMGPVHELELLQAGCAAEGVRLDIVDGDAAAALVPGLRLSGPIAHQADGGRTNADLTLASLQGRAAHHGAIVRFEDGVVAIEPDDSKVTVRTESGAVYEAETCVVTTGAWAEPVLADIVSIPRITVTKEQVAFFRATRTHPWPTFIGHGDEVPLYGMSTPDGLVKVGEHCTGPVIDPDDRTFDIEPESWRRLTDWARANVRDIDPDPVHHVTCLYASSPDENFVIDRVGRIVVGVGLGGHGFKFTPALGKHLADLADGTGWADNPFTLARHASGGLEFTVGANGHH